MRPAAAGALFPGVPLSGCGFFWGILGSLHCAPLTVGLLPGSPALICLLSAGCLLGLETSPSGEASASSCRFSWRPGVAGALAVTLPEAASQREFFPLCLVLPLPGSVTFSRVCSSVGGPIGVAHSFHPLLLLGGGLVRSAVGFADALWLCHERALSRFCASVSLIDPVALSPLLRRVFADDFRHWCMFRFCGGASPLALVP